MSGLTFESVRSPEGSFDAALAPGLHWWWGGEKDGVRALAEYAGGLRKPASGRVVLKGKNVYPCPALRRRIGSAWGSWSLPASYPWQSAEHLLQAVDALRGAPGGTAVGTAQALGLGSLLRRDLADLAAVETHRLELAVALSVPDPAALVLWAPERAELARDVLLRRCEHIARRAVVILASPLAPPPQPDTTRWLFKERYLFDRKKPGTPGLPGQRSYFELETVQSAELLQALEAAAAVEALNVLEEKAGSWRVRLEGTDRAGIARAVGDALAKLKLSPTALSSSPPTLAHAHAIAPVMQSRSSRVRAPQSPEASP